MISICLATYNGGKYIKEQLESILLQLGADDEVIISDDCSTDNTIQIIESYKEPRIAIHKGVRYASPILNFENAIKLAKGEYIFLCDQDDVWLPLKIDIMKSYLKQYDLVVSDCKVVDANLNIVSESFFSGRLSGKGFWKNIARNTYLGCCMAFRKEVLHYVLPFPENIAMHDIWIGLSVEMRGKSIFLPEQLMLYRRHGSNASFGGEKSKYSLVYKIRYRLCMLFYLLKRKYLDK